MQIDGQKWLKAFFVLLGLLSLLNIVFAVVVVPEFGDGKLIAFILSSPERLPAAKYLLGMGLLRPLYEFTWGVPALAQVLPSALTGLLGFVRVAGILLMLASTLCLLSVSHGAARILLPVTTPVWLLFSVGYIEYYPFVAGIFLGFLYWIFSRPLSSQPAVAVGMVCAVLPLFYAGFAPFAAIVFAVYLAGAPLRRIAVTLVTAAVAFVMAIWLFWAQGLAGFFGTLRTELNLGEQNTVHTAYQGLAAGDHSIFFSADYVFSLTHMKEVLHMLALGLGVAGIIGLPVAAFLLLRRGGLLRKEQILSILLPGWAVAYLLLMIPKLGPLQDVDLFFVSYLSFAFFIGMTLESHEKLQRPVMLLAWLASSLVSVSCLVQGL